eukprot:800017-Pleurochrysis_carterae.AAC.1
MPGGSRRPCRGELRRWRVARSARAHVEGGRETEGTGAGCRVRLSSGWSVCSLAHDVDGMRAGGDGADTVSLSGEQERQGEKSGARSSKS